MWVLRRFKIQLLACGLILCVFSVAYQFTNVFDIIFYLISQDLDTEDPEGIIAQIKVEFPNLRHHREGIIKYRQKQSSSNPFEGPIIILTESNELPLSLHCNAGRLGNQMCTYATLFGISALNHRRFIPLDCNVKYLKGIFTGPNKVSSMHESLYFKLHPWKLKPYLKASDAAIPQNSNFMNGYLYPCSYTFFDHVRDGLRREFQFEDHLILHAQSILQEANVQRMHDVTYVGVHVRRGDYKKRWLEVFQGVPVNMEYFQKATQYFRDKYSNVIFVAVSDDRSWCMQHLSTRFGVYVPKNAPSPAHDLALLANCNHTILTYGTFGFWGAYLAGGEVLYFDKFLKPNTTFTLNNFLFEKMYPPYWKGIVTVNVSEYFPEDNRAE